MNQRRGKIEKPISARFERKKRLDQLQIEYKSLQVKIAETAQRLGFDLEDPNVTARLSMLIRNKTIADDGRSDNALLWAENLLALAYVQQEILEDSMDEAEVIFSLCLGNWLVGVLTSMSTTEPLRYLCVPCAIKENHSRNGKAGVEKKNAPLRELEKWARAQYMAGNWPSANKAAHDLQHRIVAHGRSIGARLSEQNAQRTIAGWFRKKEEVSV